MKAEIISIGDELLLGQTINTNAAWMGQELYGVGVEVQQVTTITDQREHILNALRESTSRCDLVLITGGLGPTRDDITKEALCEFFDSKLVMNHEVLGRIRAYFESRNLAILPVNEQQAELPEKAQLLLNRRGTAMGMWFEENGKVVISMPGVPHEMQGMMAEDILPRLADRFNAGGMYYTVVQTIGKGESFIAQSIREWEDRIRAEGLSLAYLPSMGQVRLRVSGPKSERQKVDHEADQLERNLGDIVFARGDVSMPEAIAELLRNSNKTLAVAESCTGGYLAHLITTIPGSSEYFLGGVVSYSNEMKVKSLGVERSVLEARGAVSEEVVCQMAEGVRKLTGADLAISTSGIAGPSGGSNEKPVGTVWIGLSDGERTKAFQYKFGRNRERNIHITATFALNILRRYLQGIKLE